MSKASSANCMDELDYVEGVSTEVFLEACAGGDFGLVHLKLLDNNLFYFLVYCCHVSLLFRKLLCLKSKCWMQWPCGGPVNFGIARTARCPSLKDTECLGECKAKRAEVQGGSRGVVKWWWGGNYKTGTG